MVQLKLKLKKLIYFKVMALIDNFSDKEEFTEQNMIVKIVKEENITAKETKETTEIALEFARFENNKIQKQNEDIKHAKRSVNDENTQLLQTVDVMNNERKYSCQGRKLIIIGSIIFVILIMTIMIMIVALLILAFI